MINQDRRNPEKVFLKVRADHLPDGRIVPLKFKNEEGETVQIDRIVDVREAPALKKAVKARDIHAE